MAHQSFYRTHRPVSFAEVAGQSSVTTALTEQVKNGTVGHAYIFAGSRGLGKTSVARIFARELRATSKDLYEIDAASNNTVEDIRSLTENVHTLPFESPHKIYILDEAHMLSKSAWNAFLKTLEEPPSHAIFILATTELDKIPDTVQSRCQVFTFKKPSREGLAKLVIDVAEKEGFIIEPAAADLVTLLAEGSYRDALSILEKVCATSLDKKISLEEAERATGAPRRALVENFVTALSEGNQDLALSSIAHVVKEDLDFTLYLTLVLEYVRSILLVRYASGLRSSIEEEMGTEAYAALLSIAQAKESKLTHQTLKVLLDASSRLRFSSVPALPLEIAVYELFQ